MNILWFVADCLRLDYSHRMHYLQRWAKGAMTYANHFAHAHCSDPNYMSMWTGIAPREHGVMTQLDEDVITPDYKGLQHMLHGAGYATMLFGPTKPNIYQRGFDVLVPVGRKDTTEASMTGIRKFMDESKQAGKPFYAFVRTMDCHAPYWGGAYRRATRYTDDLLRDLLPWVEENHPNTAIFVFSDHGESLGEHGMRGHFSTLYDVLVHIPMYVKVPGWMPRTVDAYTRHVDLFVTCLKLAGLPVPEYAQGQDMREPGALPMPMQFEGNGAWRESYWSWRAIRDERYKYMVSAHVKDGSRFYLYEIGRDTGELWNLARVKEHEATLHDYGRQLAAMYPGWPTPDGAETWTAPYTEQEAEAVLARLRRLGYA